MQQLLPTDELLLDHLVGTDEQRKRHIEPSNPPLSLRLSLRLANLAPQLTALVSFTLIDGKTHKISKVAPCQYS